MTRLFKAIEEWASQSDDRVRLLVLLVWLGFGAIVLGATLIAALILIPWD